MLRVSVCLNAGPQKGHPQCSLVAPPSTEAILTAAANKLRLKKKEVGRARLFVWRTGYELPRNGEVEQGRVRNDDLLAIALGEPYAGPCKVEPAAAANCYCTFEGGVLDCATNYVARCEMYIDGLGVETLPAGLFTGMTLNRL